MFEKRTSVSILCAFALLSLALNFWVNFGDQLWRLQLPTPPAFRVSSSFSIGRPIPQVIIQTHKSAHVDKWRTEADNRTEWFLSWETQNPTYRHIVLDDAAALEFMRTEFPGDVFSAYEKLPLTVLRSDMLRYAMMWKWGGVYADSDTYCRRPVDTWFGKYSSSEIIVSVEWYQNTISFPGEKYKKTQLVQWLFAAKPKHKVFWNILVEMTKTVHSKSKGYLKQSAFVEEIGGPQVFSAAVDNYLKENGESLSTLTKAGETTEDGGKKRVYFEKGKVLVLPSFSFSAQQDSIKDRETSVSDHFFTGFDTKVGWKHGHGVIA
ncbi:hypothetical protein HDU83_007007 [Entophlyctis luteolus]|nr:hypothetical protein HDU83_007007 [Entophlyctis luteolus]